jgi:hypothetical protein
MKVIRLLLILFVFFSINLAKSEEDNVIESSELGVQAFYKVGIFNKYINQWNGYTYDSNPSIQSDLYTILSNGLYLDIWSAKQIDSKNDEIDLSVGWYGDIDDYSLDISLAYYEVSPLLERENNVWASITKISYSENINDFIISPFTRSEINIPDIECSSNGGIFLTSGTDISLSLIDLIDNVSLNNSFYFTYDSGVFDGDKNIIYGQTSSLQYKLNNFTLLSPSFTLTSPIETDSIRKTSTCFELSIHGEF